MVDPATVQTFVNPVISGTDRRSWPAARPVAPASVTVDVLNGGTSTAPPTTNAAVLKQPGFNIGTVDRATGQRPTP